jgi:hypothetical protein
MPAGGIHFRSKLWSIVPSENKPQIIPVGCCTSPATYRKDKNFFFFNQALSMVNHTLVLWFSG